MKFRPCMDLQGGKIKQIVGSSLSGDGKAIEHFVAKEDASYYAEMYKRDNLTGGHIIILEPRKGYEEVNEKQVLSALCVYPKGFQVGGGIDDKNAQYWLDNGASHVIATSFIFEKEQLNLENLEKLIGAVGKKNLVLDLSCRKKDETYFVARSGWRETTNYEVIPENLDFLAGYCNEFLIHGVDAEGKREGIQEDLIKKLGEWVTIPTTYAGGIKSFLDLDLIYRLGQGKLDFTIGTALDIFQDPPTKEAMPYKKVVEWRPK